MSQTNPVAPTAKGIGEATEAALPRAPEDRALLQRVSSAVRSLNKAHYAGEGREVTFSIDRASRLPVVKVVDLNTREIVSQWPAEYVLQLAAGFENSRRDSR